LSGGQSANQHLAVEVRRITPLDGAVLERVRLDALRDAPSAFGSTYAEEARRSDDEWTLRATIGAGGPDRATFLAIDGDRVVGLAGGYRVEPSSPTVELVSMWVAPTFRRRRVGHALVSAVRAWAEETGADTLALWVTTGNEPAERLYRSTGFRVTDETQPLPSDPCRSETRMLLALAD
jgi:ribosomal protein S18 acetylase RimI-like enzyme